MKSTSTICTSIVAFCAMNCSVSAEVFYSVNIGTDELVRLNGSTGASAVVGPIGVDMISADMTILGGTLYVITADVALTKRTLLTIDQSSGAALTAVDITLSGAFLPTVEGLSTKDGKLFISYVPAGFGNSRTIGELNSATGAVSNTTFFGDAGLDMDGITTAPSGNIIAVDTDFFPPSNNRDLVFFEVDLSVPSVSTLGSFSLDDSRIGDMDFTSSNLFALDHGVGELYTIDPTNGQMLTSTSLGAIGTSINGLTRVPEPSSLCLLIIAFVLVLEPRRTRTATAVG